MNIECFEINNVREEYLRGISSGLRKYNAEQQKLMMTLFDDFCMNLIQNGLTLIRVNSDNPGTNSQEQEIQEEEETEQDELEIQPINPKDIQALKLKQAYEARLRELEASDDEPLKPIVAQNKIDVLQDEANKKILELRKPKNFLNDIKNYKIPEKEEEE